MRSTRPSSGSLASPPHARSSATLCRRCVAPQCARSLAQYSSGSPTSRAPLRVYAEQRSDWSVTLNLAGLTRILLNVASNASKHTLASGSIELRIQLEPTDTGANAVIELRDTGEGMTAQFLKSSLFTPFVQASSFSPGAGLGMSIVQGIVEEMSGQIEVTSERNVGTSASIDCWTRLIDTAVRLTLPFERHDVTPSTGPLRKIYDSVDSDIATPRILTAAQTPSLLSPELVSPEISSREASPAGTPDGQFRMSDLRVLLVEDDAVSMRILSTVCKREVRLGSSRGR